MKEYIMKGRFVPEAGAPTGDEAAIYFVFENGKLLLIENEGGFALPEHEAGGDLPFPMVNERLVGRLDGVLCVSAEIAFSNLLPNYAFHKLRATFGKLDDLYFWIAARAKQLLDWHHTHQFCGRCATPTENGSAENVKICPSCSLRAYPRLAPAVIMAVFKDDKILLAHNVNHRGNMYSVLAGFTEVGETLEDTVVRETKEETNIDVTDVRYFGSQPWPFPHSLMVAFTAQYAGGEIKVDGVEIEHADWYSAENLPHTPPSISVASKLIAHFVEQTTHG